ncbi:MAG: hypothetical protein ACKVY0_29445 [Prosthecobacter sp.]|uniref:hypothetical protein n=1 Tax=Prosthecobacter sp. TaxID=1965333 RepID=UPI003901FA21
MYNWQSGSGSLYQYDTTAYPGMEDDYGSGSDTYSHSDGTLSVSYGYDNVADTRSTTVSGTDTYLGSFSATANTINPDLSAIIWVFDPRTAPAFAPPQLWVNGYLLQWQSGTVNNAGTVTDVYSGGPAASPLSLTISGQIGPFKRDYNQTASIKIQGTDVGTIYNNGSTAVTGWVVTTSAGSTSTQPYFLPEQMTLWVDGTPYAYKEGFYDSYGNHVDVYENTSVGVLHLAGTTAGTAFVVGNSATFFISGTLINNTFTVPGCAISKVETFGSAAFWVRGEFFVRESAESNTFTSAGNGSLTVAAGGAPGEISISGYTSGGAIAFSGTTVSNVKGVFLLNNNAGGAPLPAVASEANGSLHLAAGGPSNPAWPLAVSVGGVPFDHLGTAADDGAPDSSAVYYGHMTEAGGLTRLLKIRLGGGAGPATVTCTDYAAGTTTVTSTVGTYLPGAKLFQTSTPTSGFPSVHATLAGQDQYVRDLLSATDRPGLPPSFIIRGQPWWFAGMGTGSSSDVATYLGYYEGQSMLLGAPIAMPDGSMARQVTLTDPVQNALNGLTGAALTTATQGTLSDLRRSVRLRDGTVVLSGNEAGQQVAVAHADDFKLHTIASDVDIIGNNLSFGLLQGDASLAGALLNFTDLNGTATLHNTLSREQAEWVWQHAATSSAQSSLKVMKLDKNHLLQLYPKTGGDGTASISLNSSGNSVFENPILIPESGDISMGVFRSGPAPTVP